MYKFVVHQLATIIGMMNLGANNFMCYSTPHNFVKFLFREDDLLTCKNQQKTKQQQHKSTGQKN